MICSTQLLCLVSRCQLPIKSENVIWLCVRLCHHNVAASGGCFPALQGDRFNEAKCEIPTPMEPPHARAYRSYSAACSRFSFVLGHLCSQSPCGTWGSKCPWWLLKQLCAVGEDVGLALPSLLPRNGLLPQHKPKRLFKILKFTLSLTYLQTDP